MTHRPAESRPVNRERWQALRIGGALVVAALALIAGGQDTALAAFPATPKIDVQHVEPLCVVARPGDPCSGDSDLGANPGLTSILDFDYGSPIGRPVIYTGPGWATSISSPEHAVVSDLWSQVDLLCDGSPDLLAAPESAPKESIRSYPIAADPSTLEPWLQEQIPSTAVYPLKSRAAGRLNGIFLFSTDLGQAINPVPYNQVSQEVPWSPQDPNTSQRTSVTVPVLGGRYDPPAFPDLCLQSRQISTSAVPGAVAVVSATAGTLSEPAADSMTVLVTSGAADRVFAGSDTCPVLEASITDEGNLDTFHTGPEQAWSITWPGACAQTGNQIEISLWANPLPVAADVARIDFQNTRSTLAHELGHALCLQHPIGYAANNLMNETATVGEELLPGDIALANFCETALTGGFTNEPAGCPVPGTVPLTFIRVGSQGLAQWGTTRIDDFFDAADDVWTTKNATGIDFCWVDSDANTLINGSDPDLSLGVSGDIHCPTGDADDGEVELLDAQTTIKDSLRVFLINHFVDDNGQITACPFVGYVQWPGGLPGGLGDFAVIATDASGTAGAIGTDSGRSYTTFEPIANPGKQGLYLRWTVTGASVPWSGTKTDRRSPGLDISVDLRCYYFDAGGTKIVPTGMDDDGDCLAQTGFPSNIGTESSAQDASGQHDRDGDTLVDGVEVAWGSDPADADSDNDALDDFIELYLITKPAVKDTDGDGDFDTVDNCPLTVNASQADFDRDAWGARRVRAFASIIHPAVANDETDPEAAPRTDATGTGFKTKDGLAGGSPSNPEPFVIQSTALNAGGDACDNDDDNDGLLDAVECTNSSGPCTKANAPDGVSIVLLPEQPDLYPNATAPLGVACVNADVDHDGIQESTNAALQTALGLTGTEVLEAVVEVRQHNPDSDGDGWRDGFECRAGSNPDDAASVPEAAAGANGSDDDKDGAIDEHLLTPTGGAGDLDGDGLVNVLELAYSTACVRVGVGAHLPHVAAEHCPVARADIDGDTQIDVENDADGDANSGLLDADADGDGDLDGDGDPDTDAEEAGKRGLAAHLKDSDGDGCTDKKELDRLRDPLLTDPDDPQDGSDFRDVDANNSVSGLDFFAVLGQFNRTVAAGDYPGVRMDTSGAGTPDGAIAGTDFFLVLAQFNVAC